ncbi:fructose-bisphosphate aldolase class I [Alphaproteobacteria bacterium]|nr:fructose-bisphosphate aldolase class I [Alphaproteobacteria bacterium]
MFHEVIEETLRRLKADNKGILAADESVTSLERKFFPLGIENTEKNRLAYRSLFLTTQDIEKYIAGVILHEETFGQSIDGLSIPAYLSQRSVVPGIKVDGGLVPFEGDEQVTAGLDVFAQKAPQFFEAGARFTKWRAVYQISAATPSDGLVAESVRLLAQYAATSLKNGLVPIVEPEVLMDGDHDADACFTCTARVLKALFKALTSEGVELSHVILKINMIVPGRDSTKQLSEDDVAEKTARCLSESVPDEIPLVVFLSGGQSEEASTRHMAKVVQQIQAPWRITFSYGRALQDSAIRSWCGHEENLSQGQKAFFKRAEENAKASMGRL